MQEWWVNMNRNDGSTWSGIYTLIVKNFNKIGYTLHLERLKEDIEVIEDIDVQLLDKGHVVPNMGPVVFKGVWFPFLNMYEEV
jgi:hypothetical protein